MMEEEDKDLEGIMADIFGDSNDLTEKDFFEKGIICNKDERYKDAMRCFKKAIDTNPSYIPPYPKICELLWKDQKFEECIEFLTRGMKILPREDILFNLRSRTYSYLEYDTKALEDLHRAISISPLNPTYFFNRANVFKKLKYFCKSIEDYNQAIKLFPFDPTFFSNRALLRMLFQNPKSKQLALEDFEKAILLNPNSFIFHHHRALFYETNPSALESELKSALYDRNMCIKLCSENDSLKSDFCYLKGLLNMRLKDYEESYRDFESAIKYSKGNHLPALKGRDEVIVYLKDSKRQTTKYIFNNITKTWKIYHKKKINIAGIFNRTVRGKLHYHGEMSGLMKEGIGREFFDDGIIVQYFGRFEKDRRHGMGIEYFPNGEKKQRGIWKHGKFQKLIEYKTPKETNMKFINKHLRIIKFVNFGPTEEEKEKEKEEYPKKEKQKKNVKLIGHGSFSYVFYVKFPEGHEFEGKEYAFKLLLNQNEIMGGSGGSRSGSGSGMDFVRKEREEREFKINVNLDHRNIMKIIAFSKRPRGIVQELLCSSVHDLILKYEEKELTLKQKIEILFQVSKGMEYVHLNHVIHRDLNWRNVMIDRPIRDENDNGFTVKIIDFGLSKIFESYYGTIQQGTMCGSFNHVAPEIIERECYGFPVDVYSFGIMCYEILEFTVSPYGPQKRIDFQVPIKVVQGLRPTHIKKIDGSKNIPNWLMMLMTDCWNKEFKQRPNFSKIVRIIEKNIMGNIEKEY